MEKRTLKVKGSKPELYTVKVEHHGNGKLIARCNCDAGENKLYCKHRFGVLRGETANVVEGAEHVGTVAAWYEESDLKDAVLDAEERKQATKEADRRRAKIEKKVFDEVAIAVSEGVNTDDVYAHERDLMNATVQKAEAKASEQMAWRHVADMMNGIPQKQGV